MDTLEAIRTRRSIRKFMPEKVSEDTIKELLSAAMQAPSAGNKQPWQFVIIDDRNVLNEILKVHPYSKMALEASATILICGDLSLAKHDEFWIQGCSAAAQNLLLAAHARGLGAVWLGVYPRDSRIEGLRELLGIPKQIIPFCLIPIGYPNEKKSPESRYDESRIHYNRW